MDINFARAAFFIAAVLFFAALALDITVPAVALSLMALSNWVVLSIGPGEVRRGRTA